MSNIQLQKTLPLYLARTGISMPWVDLKAENAVVDFPGGVLDFLPEGFS